MRPSYALVNTRVTAQQMSAVITRILIPSPNGLLSNRKSMTQELTVLAESSSCPPRLHQLRLLQACVFAAQADGHYTKRPRNTVVGHLILLARTCIHIPLRVVISAPLTYLGLAPMHDRRSSAFLWGRLTFARSLGKVRLSASLVPIRTMSNSTTF